MQALQRGASGLNACKCTYISVHPDFQTTSCLLGRQKVITYQACPSEDVGLLVAATVWCGCGQL